MVVEWLWLESGAALPHSPSEAKRTLLSKLAVDVRSCWRNFVKQELKLNAFRVPIKKP